MRGEIWLVDLDPVQGHEANTIRPAIIVSRAVAAERAFAGHGVVTVVPVTSSTQRVFPFQVLLPAARTGLDRESKAQCEQVRSVSATRLTHRVGHVPRDLIEQVDEALRLHLDL
ncbi:type II toxin-antitoxin system PemK/MazF family toxin [Luteimicrobium subarcticum]|uniref:mRNA interferase n=1 Tax=Luteimicrobium subarcticum TaxID=620910 RepID=A0A2M8WSP2_9MICO|nr:type II toxin-antitoxin system PemK/MazF family toxin [Luteimicrobium subarcticum]PJI93928.1 mRNA interferase MazF [Luteimicrobium subarcticum]